VGSHSILSGKGMLRTMAVHRVPVCVLQNLIATHRDYFPDQKFYKMDAVLDLAEDPRNMIGSYDLSISSASFSKSVSRKDWIVELPAIACSALGQVITVLKVIHNCPS
jgi:hypothetical protein